MGSLWYAMMLRTSHRLDESLKYFEKAAQLDPNSMIIKAIISGFYEQIDKKELALKYANEALEISPYHKSVLRVKYIDLQVDGINGAIKKYKDLQKIKSNDFRSELFKLYLLRGDRDLALEEFTEIVAGTGVTQNNNYHNYRMFGLYNNLGKYEHSITWLEKAIKNKEALINSFKHKRYNELRKNDRFIQLMKSINHPAHKD